MADSAPLRGYGPGSSRYNRLQFDGDERKFELWYTKFMGYLKLRNLKHVVDENADVLNLIESHVIGNRPMSV